MARTVFHGAPHSRNTMSTHGTPSNRIRIYCVTASSCWLLLIVALHGYAAAPTATSESSPAVQTPAQEQPIGDAWSDPNNPIAQLFEGQRLDLWSLRRPQRPALPPVKQEDWVRNSIGPFILEKLENKQLTPSPSTDRHTLIRRLYFDLIGLPPSPQEIDAFINDSSPDVYEKLVDRLLANPQYGVRWVRYWLDVVRYADTNGFERDEFRPTQYHYRDYVVRAFNNDKPFDTFILE